MAATPSLTVIIPALNEEARIETAIRSARAYDKVKVIVADGGSEDQTAVRAAALGAQVVSAPRGRAAQMNAAAQAATESQTLLFLHADTSLPPDYAEHVERTLARPGVVAGAFRLRIDLAGRRLQLIAAAANARSRWLRLPYGDQALFMRAHTFHEIGGFTNLPVMEDVDLIRRLRRRGRIALAPATVITSARRYEQRGPLRLALTHQAMLAAFLFGIAPARIARWR